MSNDLPNPPQNPEATKTTIFQPSRYGGRFTRMQYFLHLLVGTIIYRILCDLLIMLVANGAIPKLMPLFFAIAAQLLFFLPVVIKSAHDIGHKGTVIVTLALAYLITLILSTLSFIFMMLPLITLIPLLIYGCILLFKDSQKGTNEYGTSTKYPDTTV